MIGLEWLRSRPRRRYANGGTVTAVEAAELVALPTGYLMPKTLPEPGEPQPVAVVEISGTVSRQQEQQIREALQVRSRPAAPRGDNLVACGCWPRYVGECRCGT